MCVRGNDQVLTALTFFSMISFRELLANGLQLLFEVFLHGSPQHFLSIIRIPSFRDPRLQQRVRILPLKIFVFQRQQFRAVEEQIDGLLDENKKLSVSDKSGAN